MDFSFNSQNFDKTKQVFWRVLDYFPHLDQKINSELLLFFAELLRFNKVINLISSKTQKNADLIHFVDSLSAAPSLLSSKQNFKKPFYDFGSGGGFPGLVLAIVNKNIPWILVEKEGKKVQFLKHICHKLKLSHVKVKNSRVQELSSNSVFTAVSRAFAPLGKSLYLAEKPAALKCQYFHFKGPYWEKELDLMDENLKKNWQIKLLKTYELPNAMKRCLLVSERK